MAANEVVDGKVGQTYVPAIPPGEMIHSELWPMVGQVIFHKRGSMHPLIEPISVAGTGASRLIGIREANVTRRDRVVFRIMDHKT